MVSFFIYSYCTFIIGTAGAMVLVQSVNLHKVASKGLTIPFSAAFAIGVIGFIVAVGVPLPWPFVPRWVVDICKAKRARKRDRREARSRERKNRVGDLTSVRSSQKIL